MSSIDEGIQFLTSTHRSRATFQVNENFTLYLETQQRKVDERNEKRRVITLYKGDEKKNENNFVATTTVTRGWTPTCRKCGTVFWEEPSEGIKSWCQQSKKDPSLCTWCYDKYKEEGSFNLKGGEKNV